MIYIIDLLETREGGPESKYGNSLQKVFLKQRSIDGACGPYSILMGLLTLGLISYEEVTSGIYRGNTSLGKFFKKLNNEYTSLLSHGTSLDDLKSILEESFKSKLHVNISDDTNKDMLDFTIEQLRKNRPTIIGVNFKRGGHWMLAIGYEENEKKEVIRILTLDPSGDNPIVSSWNSIVDAKHSKGSKKPYRYNWWTGRCMVEFEHALAIWEK